MKRGVSLKSAAASFGLAALSALPGFAQGGDEAAYTRAQRAAVVAIDDACPRTYDMASLEKKAYGCARQIHSYVFDAALAFRAATENRPGLAHWRQAAHAACTPALEDYQAELGYGDTVFTARSFLAYTGQIGTCADTIRNGVAAGASIGSALFRLGLAAEEASCLRALAQDDANGIWACDIYKVMRSQKLDAAPR